jgi:hypothetical protein
LGANSETSRELTSLHLGCHAGNILQSDLPDDLANQDILPLPHGSQRP